MNVFNYKVRHQQQTNKKVPSSIYIIQENFKEREKINLETFVSEEKMKIKWKIILKSSLKYS